MMRKGSVIGIKPECIKEYKKTHKEVWPEVLDELNKCNIKNYSVFAQHDRLFSFFEYHGQNFEADFSKMKNNAKFLEWDRFHEPMFVPLNFQNKFEGWIALEEIFRKE